jgi:hypothetical protein
VVQKRKITVKCGKKKKQTKRRIFGVKFDTMEED